ncbi:hypothetical protein PS2_037723 [Malus domestica]
MEVFSKGEPMSLLYCYSKSAGAEDPLKLQSLKPQFQQQVTATTAERKDPIPTSVRKLGRLDDTGSDTDKPFFRRRVLFLKRVQFISLCTVQLNSELNSGARL